MGEQIIKQPDGRYAVFSRISNTFVILDATVEDIMNVRAEEAARLARRQVEIELEELEANLSQAPQTPVYIRRISWDHACVLNEKHGGDLEP